LHLRLYCGGDVAKVANGANKFGQIFLTHGRRKYKDMCQGYPTFFFPNLFQNHPVYKVGTLSTAGNGCNGITVFTI
jgi:hypothetical protein